ncbi:MAG TPA: tyrosine-type recombinase/integrase [Candidatus Limnocylindrales bacterium]|nr:tyrosine-type recombinase/integrase [Candidatus Limnocylindrales bacterium]
MRDVTIAPPRRHKGSGSIYQRRDGAWIGELTVAGKRRRVTAPSPELAAFRLKSLAVEHLPDQSNGTVGDYLRVWLKELQGSGLVRPSTLIAYRRIVAHYLTPALGRLAVTELRPAHVRALTNRLAGEGLSKSTVRNVRNVLSGAMKQAIKDELITTNPARIVLPEPDYGSTAVAYRGRFVAILEAIQGHPYEDLYALIAYLGVRSGEALALDWKHIDFIHSRVTIEQTVTRKPDAENGMVGRLHIGPPKGGKRKLKSRVLPLPEDLDERLQRRAERMGRPSTGFVFLSAKDPAKPIEQSHALHRFQDALREAGLPKMRLHDLRHLYATWQIGRGTDISTVAKLLGHSTSTTTLNFYSGEVLDADKAAAAHMSFEPWTPDREKARQDKARRERRRAGIVVSRPEDRVEGWGDE